MTDIVEQLRRYAGSVCLSTPTELAAADEIERLRAAVHQAAQVFSYYAEVNSAKGTDEGYEKAARNRALAEAMQRALKGAKDSPHARLHEELEKLTHA
jgi:hypothetical protein